MKRNRHVKKNLEVFSVDPLTSEQWMAVMFPSRKVDVVEEEHSEDYAE
jgi:hypothetical protein